MDAFFSADNLQRYGAEPLQIIADLIGSDLIALEARLLAEWAAPGKIERQMATTTN